MTPFEVTVLSVTVECRRDGAIGKTIVFPPNVIGNIFNQNASTKS